MSDLNPTLEAPPNVDRIHVSTAQVDYFREGHLAGMNPRPSGGEFDVNLVPPTTNEGSRGASPSYVMQVVVDRAQRELMENVGRTARSTMRRIGSSYTAHLAMNALLFLVGVASFGFAAYKGLGDPGQADAIVSAAFGGLTAASFITYFVTRPMDSVATSGPEAAWLLAMVNTYWTKLIYLNDPVTFPTELERAQKEFEASMTAYVEAVGAHRKAVSTPRTGGRVSAGNVATNTTSKHE